MRRTRWAGLLDAAALAVGVSLIVLFYSSKGACADSTLMKGADVSFLEEIECKGGGYTATVIAALRDQGMLPDIVQVGSEMTCGMLWDAGHSCYSFDMPRQWRELRELIAAAILGVEEAAGEDHRVRIMIHIDRGGDSKGSRWFLDNLLAGGIDFDIIGQSFYPWWHGSLGDLDANLRDLAAWYRKDVVVVETAYPRTLEWHDDTHNIVGLPNQPHPEYPPTVPGQRRFLVDLMNVASRLPAWARCGGMWRSLISPVRFSPR